MELLPTFNELMEIVEKNLPLEKDSTKKFELAIQLQRNYILNKIAAQTMSLWELQGIKQAITDGNL